MINPVQIPIALRMLKFPHLEISNMDPRISATLIVLFIVFVVSFISSKWQPYNSVGESLIVALIITIFVFATSAVVMFLYTLVDSL